MTCQELLSFLGDYVDGLLPADAVVTFEIHLQGCRSCAAYLTSYRETIRMAHGATRAPRLDVSDAPEELVAAILAATRMR